MSKIAVVGATGFLGQAIVNDWQRRGHEVVAIVRRPSSEEKKLRRMFAADVRIVRFSEDELLTTELANSDVVINVAGESLTGRWTSYKKQLISGSRIDLTRRLVEQLQTQTARPSLWIQASSVAYYGAKESHEIHEEPSTPGYDYLATMCAEWEQEAEALAPIRTVILRMGIVLGRGGTLGRLLPMYKLGFGSLLGGGQQPMSWISLDDLLALITFVADRPSISGVINAVSPEQTSNLVFTHTLARVLKLPAALRLPEHLLRWVAGEQAELLLLRGQFASSKKLESLGFTFQHPTLKQALESILKPQA